MTATTTEAGDRRAVWILLLATALLLTVHLLPTPAPLERSGESIALTFEGKTCLAILLFAVMSALSTIDSLATKVEEEVARSSTFAQYTFPSIIDVFCITECITKPAQELPAIN